MRVRVFTDDNFFIFGPKSTEQPVRVHTDYHDEQRQSQQ